MNSSKFTVTGTNELSGWKIQRYLGVVSSHVVAGTGMFSDFTASITDLFGGRSGTYQKQIQSIEDEAVAIVKEKAKKLGANALLGVKIDHDEISGKSMQMFMVTVYGTAVVAVKEKDENEIEISRVIDKECLDKEIQKIEIVKKTIVPQFVLDNDEWGFIFSNELAEVNMNLLNNINFYQNESTYFGDKENHIKYYAVVRDKEVVDSIYKNIVSNPKSFDVMNEIILNCKLCDYDMILQFLKSNNEVLSKYGLLLLKADKMEYAKEDLVLIKQVVDLINSKYKQTVEYIEEKSVMSSKMKRKWVCSCGQKNDESNDRCSSCTADKYGFKLNEPSISEIIMELNKKIEALDRLFH